MSAVPSQTDLLGQVVDGRYRIRKFIGKGGMGMVYEAEAIRLGKRLCAIKVLLPEFTRNPTVVQRFEQEAQVAARIKHANVVEIFDTGTTADDLGYIAMELLIGESLDRTLRDAGPLPWPRARTIVLQICRALAAAHAQGVIHRDIKPANIFRCSLDGDDDFIKVLDFGIAKLAEGDDAGVARLTATNSVIGTYAYMASEQIRGQTIDHRVDIWAAGVILYELLTGRPPFHGTNPLQLAMAISTHDPTPMQHIVAGIPDGLDAVVARALAKDRDLRFPTADAFARALAAITTVDAPPPTLTARITAPAPAIDVIAETALPTALAPPVTAAPPPVAAEVPAPDDALDERPTKQISGNGLTELVPDELRPITHETVHTVVTPSTHPGRDAPPPPPPETMQTEIAPIFAAASANLESLPPEPRPRRRTIATLAALLSVTAGALIYLGTRPPPAPDRPDVVAAKQPEAPSQAPDPTPPAPTPSPKTSPTEPEPIPEPEPAPTSEPAPPTTPAAPPPDPVVPSRAPKVTPTKPVERPPPPPKKQESYTARITGELDRMSRGAAVMDCFARFQATAELAADIEVDATTGVATLTLPKHKQGSPLAKCLIPVFAAKKFSTAKSGEPNFTAKKFVFNKQ